MYFRRRTVSVLGHQSASPWEWARWFGRHFVTPFVRAPVSGRDEELRCTTLIQPDIELTLRVAIGPFEERRAIYYELIRDSNAMIYMVASSPRFARANDEDYADLEAVQALSDRPVPRITLLNDVHCSSQGELASEPCGDEKVQRWSRPGERVHVTSIGCLPACGRCEVGAEASFMALVELITQDCEA
jgi:hypothetical protein